MRCAALRFAIAKSRRLRAIRDNLACAQGDMVGEDSESLAGMDRTGEGDTMVEIAVTAKFCACCCLENEDCELEESKAKNKGEASRQIIRIKRVVFDYPVVQHWMTWEWSSC